MNWSDLLFDKRHVFLLNEISSVLQRIIDCTSAIKCAPTKLSEVTEHEWSSLCWVEGWPDL